MPLSLQHLAVVYFKLMDKWSKKWDQTNFHTSASWWPGFLYCLNNRNGFEISDFHYVEARKMKCLFKSMWAAMSSCSRLIHKFQCAEKKREPGDKVVGFVRCLGKLFSLHSFTWMLLSCIISFVEEDRDLIILLAAVALAVLAVALIILVVSCCCFWKM